MGRRIVSLREEDVRFLQDLRERAVRRSRELGEIIRRGRKIKRGEKAANAALSSAPDVR